MYLYLAKESNKKTAFAHLRNFNRKRLDTKNLIPTFVSFSSLRIANTMGLTGFDSG